MSHNPELKASTNYVQNRCRCDECREWANAYARRRNALNPGAKARRERERYAADIESARDKSRQWYAANREVCRERQRERYATNREARQRYRREYVAKNREELLESKRAQAAADSTASAERSRRARTVAAARQQYARALAVRGGAPWSTKEDALLLSSPPSRLDLALALGRTPVAVGRRRTYLRKLARQSTPVPN